MINEKFDKLLFKSKEFALRHDGEGVILFEIFTKLIDLDIVKQQETRLVAAIRTTGYRKVISDTSRIKLMSQEAKDYTTDHIRNSRRRYHVSHNAVVLPKEVFGKWDLKSVQNSLPPEEEGYLKMFDDIESAYDWIRN